MGEVQMSGIDVTFLTNALPDKVMFEVMDVLMRRMIFEFKRTRTAEEVSSGLKFGWVGCGDDPLKFQARVAGPHENNEIRALASRLDEEATLKKLPVKIYYERE